MSDPEPTTARDNAGIRFPPPLIFLGFLLLGLLLDRLLDLPPLTVPRWIGGVVAVAGFALIAATTRIFRAADEDPLPWTATGRIIATGPYAWSRNPMYLGMTVATIGLAIALASMTALVLALVAIGVVGGTVIEREEAYLEAKFGAAYRAYKARVRRWL